jgi:hypothetical protein
MNPEIQRREEAFKDELALLESMYPEIKFDMKASQLDFTHHKSSLSLRIPSDYPTASFPETLAATGPRKQDLRDVVQALVRDQEKGDPCLDAIIGAFVELVDDDSTMVGSGADAQDASNLDNTKDNRKKTVIIYLHHLLALTKRKLALNPSTNTPAISGITKPGYPGVLVFSGSVDAVDSHVRELKDQNWQAFQVRMEVEEKWHFKHGDGIVEVETMAEVVSEVGDEKKKDFLTAMKMVG